MKRGIPSTYVLRILASVHFGLPPRAWAKSRVELSGSKIALASCRDDGLLDLDHNITDYGRRVLARHGLEKRHANP